mgnify:CR=1 FL=1
MQTIKSALYNYLKFLVRISFPVFYRHTRVIHRERLRLQGPTILATNHPNTLIDALNAAGRANQIVHFLVNASLYKSSFSRRFFDFMFCIPIKRPQDPSGTGVKNNHSFDRLYQHLSRGGHVFIAPEGGSEAGRRLRPLKKGIARILLQVRQEYPDAPPVRILPIGFTYSDAGTFGSSLIVNVGEPILDEDWFDARQEDERRAIRDLTGHLEQTLRSLIIDTHDPEEDRLLAQMEALLQTTDPQDQETAFFRAQRLLSRLHHWQEQAPDDFRSFRIAFSDYVDALERHHITSEALAQHQEAIVRHYLWLMLGLPLYIFGYLNNFLAAGIPRLVATRPFIDVEYRATVQILLGLITVPLFYLLQALLVGQWLGTWPGLLYLLALFPSGLFAWHYRQYWKRSRTIYRVKTLRPELQLKLTGQYERFVQRLQQLLRDGGA